MSDSEQYIGFYENSEQRVPAHDPPNNGPCVVCDGPLTIPVKTISLMDFDSPKRCYFYRAHRTCYEANPQLADDLAWAHIAALEGRQS